MTERKSTRKEGREREDSANTQRNNIQLWRAVVSRARDSEYESWCYYAEQGIYRRIFLLSPQLNCMLLFQWSSEYVHALPERAVVSKPIEQTTAAQTSCCLKSVGLLTRRAAAQSRATRLVGHGFGESGE